jgi:hypothetical protein
MDKLKNTVCIIDDQHYSVLFEQDFTCNINDFKQADYLPHYKDKPHVLNQVIEDGQSCLYLQTDGKKFERHGLIIAENIPVKDDMSIELKIKPIGDSEGVGELWLIKDDGSKWVNFKIYGGYYGMKKEAVASYNGENVYLPGKQWDWGNWYYLHIRISKDKTVMALLDEDRYVLARHCYEQSVSSLFDSFSIAISQEMGMYNSRSNLMKTFITGVKVGRSLKDIQGLMSMPTKNDMIVVEVAEKLKGLHSVTNREDQYNGLMEIWKKYRTYEPNIDFYLRPLINEYIILYGLPAELLETVEHHVDTFKYFKIINQFAIHTPEELTEALDRFANYHILKSKFYNEFSDDVSQVIYNSYFKLHENSFFQKLFGNGALMPYVIFRAALFENELDDNFYSNKDWQADYSSAAFHKKTKIKIIGDILKTIDSVMRSLYGYPKLIEKPKIYKSYDTVIVTETNKFCTEHMRFNSYVEKMNIKKATQKYIPKPVDIDVSKLDDIRTAMEDIQERLITDELAQEIEFIPSKPKIDDTVTQKDFISEVQMLVIKAILHNDISEMNMILWENGLMASIVVDEINEILFDRFGDNCIEFIGDNPSVINDYAKDLKGIINL